MPKASIEINIEMIRGRGQFKCMKYNLLVIFGPKLISLMVVMVMYLLLFLYFVVSMLVLKINAVYYVVVVIVKHMEKRN